MDVFRGLSKCAQKIAHCRENTGRRKRKAIRKDEECLIVRVGDVGGNNDNDNNSGVVGRIKRPGRGAGGITTRVSASESSKK